MRSTVRDKIKTIIASALVTDAAAGTGIFQPGDIAFTFNRAAAGVYDLTIQDSRVSVLSCLANVQDGGATDKTAGSFVMGIRSVRVMTRLISTGVSTSASFIVQITALDKR